MYLQLHTNLEKKPEMHELLLEKEKTVIFPLANPTEKVKQQIDAMSSFNMW